MTNKIAKQTPTNIVAHAAGVHAVDENTLGNYLLTGDVTALSPDQRAQMLVALAKHIGVDAIARPFMLIPDGKRTVIYARAECADALSRRHGIDTDTIEIGQQEIAGTKQIVAKVQASMIDVDKMAQMLSLGVPAQAAIASATRRRSATAMIPVLVQEVEWVEGSGGKKYKRTKGLREPTGEEVANMVMKAETKAGRRAIFKLVSLGGIGLDAGGEIESAASSGEIVDAYVEPSPMSARWSAAVVAFERFGVTKAMLLAHLGIESADDYSHEHDRDLSALHVAIRNETPEAMAVLADMRTMVVVSEEEIPF